MVKMTEICNCQICKIGLADYVNEMAINGDSHKLICEKISKEKNIRIARKTVVNHLNAYNIQSEKTDVLQAKIRNQIDLNSQIDFSENNFDDNDIQSIIGYLQKIYLKIHLNSAKILLENQEKYLSGESDDLPDYALKAYAISQKIFSESVGMATIVNLNSAIRIVENSGYRLQ
jgi:hypothetical protein